MSVDVKTFHEDLKAAVMLGAPLEFPASKTGRLTVEKLEQLQSELRQPVDFFQLGLPKSYLAALKVYELTGTMVPVLDCLTLGRQARIRVRKILRSAFLYLLVLLLVASLGLWWFSDRVYPIIHDIKSDLALARGIQNVAELSLAGSYAPLLAKVFAVLFLLLILWAILGGTSKLAMWLGGSAYLRTQKAKNAVSTLHFLQQSNVSTTEAIQVSCDLVGADQNQKDDFEKFLKREQSEDKVASSDYLATLGDYFSMTLHSRINYVKTIVPVWIVAVLGGGVALIYCLIVFGPIVSLVRELTKIGVRFGG